MSAYVILADTGFSEADLSEYSGSCGENAVYEFDATSGSFVINGSGEIYEYNDDSIPWDPFKEDIEKIVINGTINSIGDSWFEDCPSLTSVTLSDSITSIEDFAFDGCTSLTSISLPDSLTYIGDYAFGDCESLVAVVIPDNVLVLGDLAFNGCSSLEYVSISGSVTSFDGIPFDGVFYESDGETELDQDAENLAGFLFRNIGGRWIKQAPSSSEDPIKISGKCGEDLTYVLELSTGTLAISGSGKMDSYSDGEVPWSSSKDLVRSVEIADSVTSIGDHAFEGCVKLAVVSLGSSVKSIGEAAFGDCTSLASYTVSENNGTYSSIDGVLFSKGRSTLIHYPGAKTDSSYEIPDTVKTIGSSAFRGCTFLTSITIPISVETVETGAFDMVFYDPDRETELDQTVENLAGSAFNEVDGKWIKQVTAPEDSDKESGSCGEDLTYELDLSTGALSISGSGKMYPYFGGNAPWSAHKDSIRSIRIADSVTTIGNFAFEGCTSLILVYLPGSIVSIGDNAFEGCTSLGSISIPDSVETMGVSAFRDCTYITELTIPITLNSVVSDKDPAFAGCSHIEKTNFTCGNGGYGYNYASNEGFDSWYMNTPWYQSKNALREINLGNGIKVIGSDAFRESNITSIEIPDTVVALGNHCFFGCIELTDLTIPISLNSYGNPACPAFKDCAAIQKVTFTNGNGTPFDYYGQTGPLYRELAPWNINSDIAKTIIITDSVTKLGACMFWSCNIRELSIPISTDLHTREYTPFFHDKYFGKEVFGNLEKVTLTEGTGIGYDFGINVASSECPWNKAPNLKTVVIGEGVTRVGAGTFYSCNLTDVYLPNTLVSFGSSAFEKCTIKNLTIPISLNAAWLDGDSAFKNVSGIEKVDFIPGSGYGFIYAADKGKNCWYQKTPWYQCRGTLKEINFSEGIVRIGNEAFRDLSINSIVIANSVETINCHAFYNINGLSSIVFPDFLTSVEDNAFNGKFYDEHENEVGPTATKLAGFTFNNINGNWFKQIPSSISGKCGEDVTYELDFDTGTLSIGGSGPMYAAFRPVPWYKYREYVKSVSISGSVTSIGGSAFADCTSITHVSISDTVNTIGSSAFSNCTSLTSIILPDSVTTIEISAFEGCTHLASVRFGKSVEYIGSFAFEGCVDLASVTLEDGVTYIGRYAFEQCFSLTSIVIPDSVTNLGNYAFRYCCNLHSITISKSLTSMGNNVFDGTFYDESGKTELDQTVENIAGSAFDEVDGKWIKQASIPEDPDKVSGECGEGVAYELNLSAGVLSISGSGKMRSYSSGSAPWFSHRDSIRSVEIADSVTSIGDFAFEGCTELATVSLGKSVSTIGESAFRGCTSLASYAVSDGNSKYGSIDGVLFSKDGTVLIQYPAAKEGTFYEVPGTVDTVAPSAFKGCTSLTSISIPDSVESVGAYAFRDCTSLKSVELSDPLTSIGAGTFYNCSALVSVAIPCSVTSVGNYAFYGCTSLTTLILPGALHSIGSYAFSGCTSLTSVSLPDSVNSLGTNAFAGCTSLASLDLGNSVISIGRSAFKGCISLTTLKFPGSITSIGDSAFDGKFYDLDGENELEPTAADLAGSAFDKVEGKWVKQAPAPPVDPNKVSGECGEGVTYELDLSTGALSISGSGKMSSYSGGNAPWFSHKDSIRSIEIADSVSSIGDFAFEGITAIEFVTVPDSVETIGVSAFEGCTGLAIVNLGRSVNSVGKSAFEGCPSLASFVVSEENGVYCSVDGVLFSRDRTVLVQYPVAKEGTSYEMPDTVKIIRSSAFEGCTSFDSITIPYSVTSIEAGAFNMVFYDPVCKTELDQTVENLAGSTFCKVDGKFVKQNEFGKCGEDVAYELDLSAGVLAINGSGKMESYSNGKAPWFSHRDSIKSIEIADSVSSIGDFAFEGIVSLEHISIPDSVEIIGASAFESCTELATVNLGKSVDSIDRSAFYGCSSLASYVVSEDNGTYSSIDGVLFSKDKSILIQYPVAKADASYEIPAAVRTIAASAFNGCASLASITIPGCIDTVEEGAFDMVFYDPACEDVLEQTVENLAGSTFCKADGKFVKQNEFGKCGEGVTYELDLSAGTLAINGSGTMNSYSSGEAPWFTHKGLIDSIVIGDNVVSIGDFAFEGITLITFFTVPDSVETIGVSAFEGCTSLATVNLGNSVNSVGGSAFSGCSSLASYVVSEDNGTYTSVDGVLFSKDKTTLIQYPVAKADTSYAIPDTVETIKSSAFGEPKFLVSLTVPDSVETVETGAFDTVFYDTSGETELNQTVENLAGSVFGYVEGKWIRQKEFGKCGESASYEFDFSTGILTVGGSGKMGSYSNGKAPWFSHKDLIASVLIGDSVTSIGDFAFEGITTIGSVTLPDSVETVGVSAFEGCISLAAVKFGSSVTKLGKDAFSGCPSLASYAVSDNNSTYASIDGVLFSKGQTILFQYPAAKAGVSYEIPDTVRTVGSSAFKGCVSLASITIPDSVKSIEAGAFDMVFYDPAGENSLEPIVENLAGSTFNEVDGKWIKQVFVPPADPDKVSGKCGENVTYELDLSAGTLVIGGSGKMESYSSGNAPWFSHKDSIRSVEIADAVTSIGDHAFEGIASIGSISVPDSVETIGASAFEGCTDLAAVTIGKSVSSLGKAVFRDCISLASFAVSDGNHTYRSIDGVLFSKDQTILIQYPVAKKGTAYEIPDAVTAIASSAFKGCVSLASITIPDSVKSLGASAFEGCAGLKELTVPASLDCVGSNENPCFAGCVNIETVTFTKGDGTWYGYDTGSSQTASPRNCSGTFDDVVSGHLSESDYRYTPWQLSRPVLTTVMISEGVTSIGDSVFKDCSAINSLTIGNTVAVIGDSAFSDCTSLASVVIPDSVISLGASAFRGCMSLTSIDLPDSVESIGESAFEDCTSLESVTLPDSAGSIGESVFGGCNSLSAFKVSEESSKYCCLNGVLYNKGMTKLIRYPAGNTDPSFEIPDGIISIASNAFQNNTSLTTISLPASLRSIGDGAFNAIFYDTDGETVLEQATADLAGFTFDKIDGKWIKQSSAPLPSPSPEGTSEERPETVYLLATILAVIALLAAVDFVKKKKF